MTVIYYKRARDSASPHKRHTFQAATVQQRAVRRFTHQFHALSQARAFIEQHTR